MDENFERYDRCLNDVVALLGLEPKPRPAGDAVHDRRLRRRWQAATALMIMRQAQPPLPAEVFEPLMRAAVYEPDPSHNARHIVPAVMAFGRRRVLARLLDYLRTGTDYEIGGAASAWYNSWYPRIPDDDRCTDLRREFQEAGLHVFLTNEDLRVRCRVISMLNLDAGVVPEEQRPVIAEVIRIAKAHSDDTIVSRIRSAM
jgi:hypothetical protein